jgi:hypothetical protein
MGQLGGGELDQEEGEGGEREREREREREVAGGLDVLKMQIIILFDISIRPLVARPHSSSFRR